MDEMIVKLTPVEADTMFPCTEDLTQTDVSKVNDDLVCGAIREVVNNCGLEQLSTIDTREYFDYDTEQLWVDQYGDYLVSAARFGCTMMDNGKISFLFVCVM